MIGSLRGTVAPRFLGEKRRRRQKEPPTDTSRCTALGMRRPTCREAAVGESEGIHAVLLGGGGQVPPPLRRPGKDALLPHLPALPSGTAMLAAPYHLWLVTNRFPKLVATRVNEPPSAARRNSRLGAAVDQQEKVRGELGWTRAGNEQRYNDDYVRRELSLIRSRSLAGDHVVWCCDIHVTGFQPS